MMKKLIISTIVLLMAGLLSTCRKDDRQAFPTVRLVDGPEYIVADTSASPGSLLRFRVEMKGDEYEITNFLIGLTTDTFRTVFDTGVHAMNLEWEGSFFRGFYETERWQFIVRDRWGNDASASLNISLGAQSEFRPLEYLGNITLGAQENQEFGSFFSFQGNRDYELADCNASSSIQSIIDLVFYYGDDLSTIASPGANIESGIFEGDLSAWEVRNTTRLMETQFSLELFDDFQNDSILIATYDESQAKRKAKALQENDNYVFRLPNERLGLFFVKELSEGPSGRIIIDVKLQAYK